MRPAPGIQSAIDKSSVSDLCMMAKISVVSVSSWLLAFLILSNSTPLLLKHSQPVQSGASLLQDPDIISPDLAGSTNKTNSHLLTVWPKLPWWTKIQDSNPEASLDISSVGIELNALQAYTLQEAVLLPFSLEVYKGIGPAETAQNISSGGIRVSFLPNVNRPPSRGIAAKSLAALAFLEKKYGGRTVKAGLRLGMVRVAGIEIQLSEDAIA